MKRVFILSTVLFLVSTIMLAQEKVVDHSGKRPSWVGGSEEGFIITSAEDITLEDAKSKTLVQVRDRIVNSVAVVVKSSSSIDVNEKNSNEIYDYLEQYSKSTTNVAADQNFVKGISESKIADYYWEKVFDKGMGKTKYIYNIKYTFSNSEIAKLVAEFERKDREMTDKLTAISKFIESYSTVEEMTSAVAELSKLATYFPDQRKHAAQVDIAKLSKMLNSIAAEIVGQETGKLEVRLVYAGKLIKTSKTPSVRSNCCVVTSNKQSDGVWIIHYDSNGCFSDLENTIDIAFTNGINARVKAYIEVKD